MNLNQTNAHIVTALPDLIDIAMFIPSSLKQQEIVNEKKPTIGLSFDLEIPKHL